MALVVRVLSLGALVLACMLVPVSGAAAAADDPFHCTSTCRHTDPRGDAPPQADILSARVSNAAEAFTLTLKVRNLPRTGRLVLGAGLSGWGVNYFVSKTARGYRVMGQEVSEVDVYPKVRCSTARVTWNERADVVKAVFPYECTGSSAGGGTIINGVDFFAGGRRDSIGKIFYEPDSRIAA